MSSPAAATQVGLEGQVAASVVALVEADQAPILARSFYPAEGSPSPITASLAHVPEVLEATLPFVGRILGPTAIDARTKEIVIVRTSALMECRYCVETHSVVALDCGLSREEVRALRGEGDIEAVFTDPGELALLAWVDAVALGRGAVPEEITARAKGAMGDPELVELTLVAEQIASGAISERLWFYANYHCNLRCTYCLTESAPEVDRREFGREQIIERARQGKGLGFTALGVTGGEKSS